MCKSCYKAAVPSPPEVPHPPQHEDVSSPPPAPPVMRIGVSAHMTADGCAPQPQAPPAGPTQPAAQQFRPLPTSGNAKFAAFAGSQVELVPPPTAASMHQRPLATPSHSRCELEEADDCLGGERCLPPGTVTTDTIQPLGLEGDPDQEQQQKSGWLRFSI